MLTQAQTEILAQTIHQRSVTCERGVVAIREDGQAGVAKIAPNSLVLSVLFFDGAMITDLHLN